MSVPQIFDRNARRLRRDRIAGAPESFLVEQMVDEIVARLDVITHRFANALVIGGSDMLMTDLARRGIVVDVIDASPRIARYFGGRQAEEDQFDVDEASHDLVISAGVLDTVSDLPGALTLARRALRPDGLFLAVFVGAPSLPALRNAVAAADAATGIAAARLHPQVDVRSAGDLLVRAGFALPVADTSTLDLSYRSLGALIDDLRAAAATNVLLDRHRVTRNWLASASAAFDAAAGNDGRTRETVTLITLTGWAPAPEQPRPARRGSGSTSLANALARR